MESHYGSFQRHVPLPEGVKPENILASYENGVLEVVVPKAAALTEPTRIPITVGGGRKVLTTKGRRKLASRGRPFQGGMVSRPSP